MTTEKKSKRKRYDKNAPEARALIDEIVHGTFMKEGTMVAFPMCFPGVTVPIVADESHITALDTAPDGMVYGGTSGRASHLFVAMFHGVTGCVFDLGVVEGATQTMGVACGKAHFVAGVNGQKGGRLLRHKFQPLPFDLLQEWGFSRPGYEDLGQAVKGERIVSLVASRGRNRVVGATTNHVFLYDFEKNETKVLGEARTVGELGVGPKGGVCGFAEEGALWRVDPKGGTFKGKAVKLPRTTWDGIEPRWASSTNHGAIFTADAEGQIFAFEGGKGFSDPLGKTRLAPVGPMTSTLDGRVFGFCGEEMARMFCFDPERQRVSDIGVAVSTIERRRYGYVFGAATCGRDGQVFFGEDDDLGHLWIYFPKIAPAAG